MPSSSKQIIQPALGTGAKVGIVFVIILLLTAIGILIYYVYRYRKQVSDCRSTAAKTPCVVT